MSAIPIRAICFDFDQTLAYMQPSHWALYAEAARAAGIEVSEAALAAETVDRAWAPWMTPLGPVHLDASVSQEAFRALRASLAADRIRAACTADETALAEAGRVAALLEEDAARYVLYEDTLPALRRMRDAGVPAYIVSNHIWTLPEIASTLLGDLVAAVVTSARCGVRKPHPAIFEAALALSGTPPGETLMVGDSLGADVRGGERAGMRAVLLDREGTTTTPEDVRTIATLLDVPLEWSAP